MISLRIVPRASRSAIRIEDDDSIKVRLQAPPVDGKANKALVRFLAKSLGVPKRNIGLISGETSRIKRILITGWSVEEIAARVSSAAS